MNSLERSGSGTGLLLAGVTARLGKHAALGNEENVNARELLLELSCEAAESRVSQNLCPIQVAPSRPCGGNASWEGLW